MKNITITIDGPSGSGKGTTAKRIAERLGLVHVDSGALYRAVAYALHTFEIEPSDGDGIIGILPQLNIAFNQDNHITIDGELKETEIRSRENSKRAFAYSRNETIREYVTELQRTLLAEGGVLDGRDAGSVVAPHADLKIYLDCDIDIRARRRAKQYNITDEDEIERIKLEIQERDNADMNKGDSSLRILPDSVVVDTGEMTIDEQVERVYELAQNTMTHINE